MSVELILYPQNNKITEYISDGIDFSTLDFAPNVDISPSTSAGMYNLVLSNQPASVGNWRRFRNVVNGTMALPDGNSGNCVINSIAQSNTLGRSGVYQGLSGLVVGDSYTLEVKYTTGFGFLSVAHTDGTTGNSSSFHSLANLSTTTTFSYQFNAISTSDVVFVAFVSTSASNLTIESISVRATNVNTFEGQVICDLYEDEEIPLSLSVDDFKNVAEKVQSYSKDFNLPATKRNNKIFGSIFEITKSVGSLNSFNPLINTRAVLKQNGLMLFDGSLKLIDIQDREGEISYNVNLFAQTIALADTLKNKTFDDINFDELQHNYDKTAIKASWYASTGLPLTNPLPTGTYAGTAGSSTTQVLKYPFVDWTGQILIANGATGSSATLGMPELTSFEQAFRPFIQIKYLIDRIFSEADYTYTSTLFSSSDFANLYMDFNWGGDSMPSVIGDTSYTATYPGQGVSPSPFTTNNAAYMTLPLLDNSVTGGLTSSEVPPDYNTTGADIYKIVSTSDNQLYSIDYSWGDFETPGGPIDLITRWQRYDASTGNTSTIDYQSVQFGNVAPKTVSGSFSTALDTGDKLWAEFTSSSATNISLRNSSGQVFGTVTFNLSSSLVGTSTLNSKRGEVNQWEFIRGIFTMFNLITLEDKSNPGNIIIESYSDVFTNIGNGTSLADRGIKHNWTDKVDVKDIKLKPLNDLKKKTTFRFEEDEDDYIFSVYKRSTNGHLYGSKVFSASGFTVLDGEDEIIASPFAATVSKPLAPAYTNYIVPTIYSVDDDGQPSGFDNMPRILYNSTGASPTTTTDTYYIPTQNGTSSENVTNFFTFSHLSEIPTTSTTDDYNFGECQLISPIGSSVTSNLFNNNWLPYYKELYNSDTKVMVIKVNLSPGDIATFEFSDMVMIKNRAYRVNRIDYKPKDLSTVEFILIP